MAHGMGIPSCSIYATELVREYGVRTLIRVGSCGVLAPDVKLGDVIIAMGASTDSKVNRVRFLDHDFAAHRRLRPGRAARSSAARAAGVPVRVGNVFSSDFFYTPQPEMFDVMEKLGHPGRRDGGRRPVRRRGRARRAGPQPCSRVSDHIRRHEHLSSEERRTSFDSMIRVALETVVS